MKPELCQEETDSGNIDNSNADSSNTNNSNTNNKADGSSVESQRQSDYQVWLKLKKLRELTTFPLVKGIQNAKLCRIYPLMQESVQQILELLSGYPVSLSVFGSSLNMRCNIMSDLDLCIKTKEYDKNFFYFLAEKIACTIEVKTDIIYYNDLTEQDRIKKEIDKNGYWIQEAI